MLYGMENAIVPENLSMDGLLHPGVLGTEWRITHRLLQYLGILLLQYSSASNFGGGEEKIQVEAL